MTEKRRKATLPELSAARELHELRDSEYALEFDEDAQVSEASDAVWVQCWARVPLEEV